MLGVVIDDPSLTVANSSVVDSVLAQESETKESAMVGGGSFITTSNIDQTPPPDGAKSESTKPSSGLTGPISSDKRLLSTSQSAETEGDSDSTCRAVHHSNISFRQGLIEVDD